MKRAFEDLVKRSQMASQNLTGIPVKVLLIEKIVQEAIVDGLYTPDIAIPCRALVKADALIPAVMAASILAKQARDRVMEDYARLYPAYGYDKHKGYPTKAHLEKIAQHGMSPIQRKTFRVSRIDTGREAYPTPHPIPHTPSLFTPLP
jgi:ribonuclease HII